MNFRNKYLKLIVFIKLIFLSKQQEITGIYQIIEDIQYPIVFDANEVFYNVVSDAHFYIYYKETNVLDFQGDSNLEYDSPLLLFKDPENNYLILVSNNLYSITLGENNEITQINLKSSEFSNFQVFGYIQERLSSGSIFENADSNLNEIITYVSKMIIFIFIVWLKINLKMRN